MRTTKLTWGQYRHLLERWSNRYLEDQNHWTIEGRPVCAFLNIGDFVATYGLAVFGVMIRYAVSVVEGELRQRPYMLGVIGQANRRNARIANDLPLDAVTGYGLLPNWLGSPIQNYKDLIDQRVNDWEHLQRDLRIPFFPVVCAGWDATVRGPCNGILRREDGYPTSPVVTGVTKDLFGYFLDQAIAFNERWRPRQNIIFLHAWNEWTESSVIEPSDKFGFTLLNEVKARAIGVST